VARAVSWLLVYRADLHRFLFSHQSQAVLYHLALSCLATAICSEGHAWVKHAPPGPTNPIGIPGYAAGWSMPRPRQSGGRPLALPLPLQQGRPCWEGQLQAQAAGSLPSLQAVTSPSRQASWAAPACSPPLLARPAGSPAFWGRRSSRSSRVPGQVQPRVAALRPQGFWTSRPYGRCGDLPAYSDAHSKIEPEVLGSWLLAKLATAVMWPN
jgi:hypothetical protein